MAELPPALRRELPRDAQRAYRSAYREAVEAGADEDTARLSAQEAVEEAFRRVGDTWERRDLTGTGGPYGEAAIAHMARRARFPCTSGQLVAQAGDPVIEIAPGQPMALRDVLDLADGGYWRDTPELLEAVHAAWPKVRKRAGDRLSPRPQANL